MKLDNEMLGERGERTEHQAQAEALIYVILGIGLEPYHSPKRQYHYHASRSSFSPETLQSLAR